MDDKSVTQEAWDAAPQAEVDLERDKWRCIGCGNLAEESGDANCECPTGLLYLRSSPGRHLSKIEAIDRGIAVLQEELIAHQAERADVLAAIRSKLT